MDDSDPMASPSSSNSDQHELDVGEKLRLCELRIGYTFRDKSLLQSALTHASGADHRLASNERLEFLGDAILGLVVCEVLYRQFPEYLEGDLTRIKSVVVSRNICAKLGEALRLQDCMFVGKGVLSNPVVPPSLFADAIESLVAALYLDGGMEIVCAFLNHRLAPEIEQVADGDISGNYKSHLQQYSQREFGVTPTYQLVNEEGPDHAKCFQVAAQIGPKRFEPAWGRNKKEAEQKAACNALVTLLEPRAVAEAKNAAAQ